MRTLLIIFICALFFVSCSNDKNKNATDTNSPDTGNPIVSSFSDVKDESKNVKDGIYEERYKNGVIKIKGEYGGGKRFGQLASWYESGKLWSEGTYKNGLKEGKWTVWNENGKKRYEGSYKENKETGKWMFWDDKGDLSKEMDYDKENK